MHILNFCTVSLCLQFMTGILTTPNFDFQVHNSTQLVISTAPPKEKVTTNCKENASALSQPKTPEFQTFWSHTKEMGDVK